MVLRENGIKALAKLEAQKNEQTEKNQQEGLVGVGTGENSTTTTTPTPETPTLKQPQIKDNLNQVINEQENTTVYDEYNNPVEIPAGFKVVPHGITDVTYEYSENQNSPTVQDGIVVSDKDGNQFVWIPLETDTNPIKNKAGDTHDGATKIKLGRYEFNAKYESGSIVGDGKATLVQSAEQYAEYANQDTYKNHRIYLNNDEAQDEYYYESTSGNEGNIKASNLQEFIASATKNGGYYLARFEAGIINYNKEKLSEIEDEAYTNKNTNWTGYTKTGDEELKVVSKKDQQVWNYITQNKASEVAKGMYPENNNYTSDLVNSYAWDTAIVFIRKYSDYAKTNLDYSEDKKCNIYNMVSNYMEWTTETSSYSGSPCVSRGSRRLR